MSKSRAVSRKPVKAKRSEKNTPAPRATAREESAGPGPVEKLAPTGGQITPDKMLWLQRSVGNRTAMRLLENQAQKETSAESITRVGGPGVLAATPISVTHPAGPDPAVQRLISVAKLDKKTKASAKKAAKKGDAADPGRRAAMDNAYDKIKAALEQFHNYNKQFKKLDPAYADHVENLKKLQQVLAESEKYIAKATPGDPRLAAVQSLLKDARDTYVKASPNAKRAKTARNELKSIKKKDKNSPGRITDEIINMMVMGVAAPMSETDEKGASGILGISAAVEAAETLVMMQQKEYDKMLQILAESGDDPGVVAKKATLLRALAARKKDLIAAGPQSQSQMFVIEIFGIIIRDMDTEKMVESTHTAERGSGEGLQQRFTMSCGPTSVEIVHGEIDPVHAFILSGEGKKSLDPTGMTADKQKELLENLRGADKALPRVIEDDWTKLVGAANTFISGPATAAQQAQVQAAFAYFAAQPHNVAKKNAGLALLKTLGTGVDIDVRTPQFRKFYAILGSAPGINIGELVSMAKSELGDSSSREFKETPISYKEKLIKGKKELRGDINKHFWKLDKALFRGDKVPFVVMWAGGGGHVMVFVDKRKKRDGGKLRTHYLIADPWTGKSGWMDRTDISKGSFGKIGQGQGAVASIHL